MGFNPSHFKSAELPVDSVSYYQVNEFIGKLNKMSKIQFRLPTFEEWEYAAGGGKEKVIPYSGTDKIREIGKYAWTDENSNATSHKSGSLDPNRLGLFDMIGNLWEWTNNSLPENNSGLTNLYNAEKRVILKGGSWNDRCVDVYKKVSIFPDINNFTIGFRLAFSN